jgi:hypothetical protein
MFTFLPFTWAQTKGGVLVTGLVSWFVLLSLLAFKLPYVSKYQPSKTWAVPVLVGLFGGVFMYNTFRARLNPIVAVTETFDLIIRSLSFNTIKIA